MKKIYLLMTGMIVLCLLACNSDNKQQTAESKPNDPDFEMQKAKAFIDSINGQFSEHIRSGDSVWVASQYGSDAEILLEKMEPITAKDIPSFWGEVCRSQARDWTFTTTDLQGDENFLVETGNYEIRDANKKLSDKGEYVVIWKKQNGKWKLHRDVGISSPTQSK